MSCDVKFVGGGRFDARGEETHEDFLGCFSGLFPSNCFFDVIYFATPVIKVILSKEITAFLLFSKIQE